MFSRLGISCLALALLGFVAPVSADGGDRGGWELGIFGGYGFPDDYVRPSGPALALEDDLILGARLGYWYTSMWSTELSYQTMDTTTGFALPAPNVDVQLEAVRLNVLANFNPGKSFRPFLTAGIGEERLDILDVSDIGANVGAGARWGLTDKMSLRWDIKHIWADHDNAFSGTQSNLETALGLSWILGGGAPPDADGDGVSDRKDRCPDTPRGATVDDFGCPADGDVDGVFDGIDKCPDTPTGHKVDATGCSMDSDGDGVHDGPDACPNTPKGATVDTKGCPTDSDGDGVFDGIDKCPDTPRGATVDATGCSADSDGDGVADGIDRCPDTPQGAEVAADGCPKDGDGDGVFDGIDRCPDTAPGTQVDEKGCAILFEEEQMTLVLENVLFEFNSADLTEESKRVLDRIAPPLVESFADVRVEVSGHTDSVGSDAYNRTLSQRRAESVMDHLIGAGVAASRLEARGYGESQPIADNGTDMGRAQNRRVELKRLN